MSKRPEIRTISLNRHDHERQWSALSDLATALGFDGNVSELIRWLAEVYSGAAGETILLLKAAGGWAGGGDEWDTLLLLKSLLPPIKLAVDEE